MITDRCSCFNTIHKRIPFLLQRKYLYKHKSTFNMSEPDAMIEEFDDMGNPYYRARSQYSTCILQRVLSKYFYTEGSAVWVRVEDAWLSGSVVRVERADPAERTVDGLNKANMATTVTVDLRDEEGTCTQVTKKWELVFPKRPPFLEGFKNSARTRLERHVFLARFSLVPHMKDQAKRFLEDWLLQWKSVTHYQDSFEVHDLFLIMLLRIAHHNGDAFNLSAYVNEEENFDVCTGLFRKLTDDNGMMSCVEVIKEHLKGDDFSDVDPMTTMIEEAENAEDLEEEDRENDYLAAQGNGDYYSDDDDYEFTDEDDSD